MILDLKLIRDMKSSLNMIKIVTFSVNRGPIQSDKKYLDIKFIDHTHRMPWLHHQGKYNLHPVMRKKD